MSFLDIDKICPVCGNIRNLYIKIGDKILKETSKNNFTSFKCCNEGDYVNISYNNNLEIKSNFKIIDVIFYLTCNEDIFCEYKTFNTIICVFYSCSTVQSETFFFIKGELIPLHSDKLLENNINLDCFTYNDKTDYCYRFYNVNYDYYNERVNFYCYNIPFKEEDNEYYIPTIFDKKLPLFYKSPSELKKLNLSNSTKMIEKFESWKILS
jgi:hypothetical protein